MCIITIQRFYPRQTHTSQLITLAPPGLKILFHPLKIHKFNVHVKISPSSVRVCNALGRAFDGFNKFNPFAYLENLTFNLTVNPITQINNKKNLNGRAIASQWRI